MVVRDPLAGLGEGEADHDEQHPESQERQVPSKRRAEVVADVMDAQDLAVDEALVSATAASAACRAEANCASAPLLLSTSTRVRST